MIDIDKETVRPVKSFSKISITVTMHDNATQQATDSDQKHVSFVEPTAPKDVEIAAAEPVAPAALDLAQGTARSDSVDVESFV